MLRTLLLFVVTAHAEFWSNDDTSMNKQKGWIEDLKRRLMADNYDYQPSSGEYQLRARDETPSATPTETTDFINNPINEPTNPPKDEMDREIEFAYESLEKVERNAFDGTTVYSAYAKPVFDDTFTLNHQNSIEERDDTEGISRNDVHVYIKDSKRQDPVVPVSTPVKNVSYKILQPSLLSRRADGAAPRFVEEVGANGVSLLSVDGAPFPDFQLPSARRQYQAARDSFSEDWID